MFKRILVCTFLFLGSSLCLAETAVKDWTIYIHLNADNNLCSYASKDLTEIKTLDVTKTANIIVAFDCSASNDSKIIEIQGDKEIDVTKEVLGIATPTEFDMGDYKFFQSTAQKVFQKYPAKHLFIDIWNHGSGWNFVENEIDRGVSYDDQSGNHITTVQLGVAMKEISGQQMVDILGFDACLMQMIEISYEYADYAKYTLASEDNEPGDGWDYRGLVKALSIADATPEDVGKAIVDSYMVYYPSSRVTLSLVDNQNLKELTKGLAGMVPSLQTLPGMKKIVSSIPGWGSSFKDIGLFLDKLPADVVGNVKDLYKSTVFYAKASQPSTGLSIYLSSYPSAAYLDLKFAKDTGWYNFLKYMKP